MIRNRTRRRGETMVAHARTTYPNECCGAMIGRIDGDKKMVTEALPLENAYAGAQGARYELRPEDLLRADREARGARTGPDRHLPFASGLRRLLFRNRSEEFVSLVFVRGAIDSRAASSITRTAFCPNAEQTRRRERRIDMAKILIPTPLRQFADKHDSVELTGATVGEVLTALTTQYPEPEEESLSTTKASCGASSTST